SQIGDSDLERVFMNLVYRSDIGEDDNLRISVYHHTYDLDYVFTSGTGNYIYAVDTTGGEFQYTLKNKIMGRQNTLIFGPSIRTDSADTQAYETDEQGGKTDEIKSDTLAEPVFWAFYIQDELKLTESLSMTLGLRYDRAEFENLDRLDPEDSGEAEMDAVSPKFGLAYKLFPHTTLFANVGKGFAPPSISNLYTSANSNPDLDPETAMNYELSMRTAPVDWLDLTTTIYQMDVTDEIISVEVDGDAKKINAGETRHKGLETELNLHFPMGFTSFVNLTLQDVKFEDHKVYSSRSGTTTVYDGNKLPHAPDKQLTAGLRYRHPIGLICSLTVRYEDEKYTDEANRYLIPDYTVWSTRLEYKNKYKDIKYSFRLSVNNLFDKNYYSSGTGSSVYPSAPRTYLLGATVTF
ncbi:MAG: TonB-dependent receptor, partial [Desulfobacteraceae bacterium]